MLFFVFPNASNSLSHHAELVRLYNMYSVCTHTWHPKTVRLRVHHFTVFLFVTGTEPGSLVQRDKYKSK